MRARQAVFLLTALLAEPGVGHATVIHVLPDGSGDAPTIAAAFTIAALGDTVSLGPGTYFEFDLVVPGVTLLSDTGDPATTTIDAGGQSSAPMSHSTGSISPSRPCCAACCIICSRNTAEKSTAFTVPRYTLASISAPTPAPQPLSAIRGAPGNAGSNDSRCSEKAVSPGPWRSSPLCSRMSASIYAC